jgi:PIN domain nuclease of toxin-antitoxin system
VRLLLDTHIWIWYYTAPEKLTSEVARQLANPANDRFLSPVNLRQDFGEWFRQSVADMELLEAPLHWRVAHELRFTMLSHRDPADRFLVATAKVYDLTLVTADESLMSVQGLSVLPNR